LKEELPRINRMMKEEIHEFYSFVSMNQKISWTLWVDRYYCQPEDFEPDEIP
jgi:hypothetical protein